MYPTPFQKKICWYALAAVSCLALAAVLVFVGWLVISSASFLQPILLPIAIAGILAYLLDPVVALMCSRGLPRILAVLIVFAVCFFAIAGMVIYIVPSIHRQGISFAEKMPAYTLQAQALVVRTSEYLRHLAELPILKHPDEVATQGDQWAAYTSQAIQNSIAWIQKRIPDVGSFSLRFLQRSIGGALGVFGFLLSLVLVPIFLFFFLKEGPAIANSWSNYLPLRASPFKNEVVSLLTEINSYLIAFFRGQLLVSLCDGFLIAFALLFVGLDFSLVIGVMVGFLGLIPYAGVIISWIPAVLIATFQFGDWWHPLLVTMIFLAANWIDGLVIAPLIVGESVGLHPLTVIISVLAWSLILGGLLGALLAVPLTATLKVVLKRYFWDRPATPDPAPKSAHPG